MRGLEKPAPPSNVSPDGQAPRGLVDAEGEYLATCRAGPTRPSSPRHTFDGLDKARLREVLYGEQKSLCVYCERTISESDPSASCRALAPSEQSSGVRAALAQPVPLVLNGRHVRCPEGPPTPQGRRRRSGPSVAHRARLRRVGRLHQPGRDVRPRRRAHGRGNPQRPQAGHRRRPARGRKTAAGHPQSQSPDSRGGSPCGDGQRTDAVAAGPRAGDGIE